MTLKQFFRLLRQQRLFSSIYIICTALSVALAMTLFLVLYIKFGPVYPEQERARMAVVDYVAVRNVKSDQAVAGRANFQLADTLGQPSPSSPIRQCFSLRCWPHGCLYNGPAAYSQATRCAMNNTFIYNIYNNY